MIRLRGAICAPPLCPPNQARRRREAPPDRPRPGPLLSIALPSAAARKAGSPHAECQSGRLRELPLYMKFGPAMVRVRHPMVIEVDDETLLGHDVFL